MPPKFTLTKRPLPQMLLGMSVSVGFMVAALAGHYLGQMTIALNGYIVMIVFVCQVLVWRFWLGFGREVQGSQSAIEQFRGKSASHVLKTPRETITPVFVCVLQDTLIKAKNGRGSDHSPILAAYETGMLQRPLMIQMLACRCTPSLGMSATVLGLFLVMLQLGHGLQFSNDTKVLVEAILAAVGSLAMSFSTTATALVLGPLMLGVQTDHCRRAVHQYIDQLDAILSSFNFENQDNGDRGKNGVDSNENEEDA